MPTGCSPCCIPPCREGDDAVVTSHAGYLETRRAPGPPDASPPCCCRLPGLRLSTAVTPATTTTTVTPCTPPPPGALVSAAAERAAAAAAAGPSQRQTHDGDPGDGDGDRALLDAESAAASAPRQPCSRCGAAAWCSGYLGLGGLGLRSRCALSPARVASLRDLEGRCCAVLAILTFMGMVVGLALFSDPLLLDLSTRLQRAHCVTVNYTIVEGATNCTWASCRESCTTQAYKCPQIFVNYSLIGEVAAVAAVAAGSDFGCTAVGHSQGGTPHPAPRVALTLHARADA